MKKEMVGNVSGNILGMLADLAHKLQHGVITESQLGRFLQKQNPFDLILGSAQDQLESWRRFYLDEFGIELEEVDIPEPRPGFDRLIVVAKDIQQIYDRCQKYFRCWRCIDENLNKIVVQDRDFKNGAYTIWIRDLVEADEEFRDFSANKLKKKNIQGITMTERLLYELKYFTETGKHLDIQNTTLCSGSRDGDSRVPSVNWFSSSHREMHVSWYNPADARVDLRTREVVS